jgi:tRNA (guanine-N7-)-methyltransferase
MATDWAPYAGHMREAADACPWFEPAGAEGAAARPHTKLERRGLGLGHEVADLLYLRNDRRVSRPPSRP